MKKSCVACGQPLDDETKQVCPRCEKLVLSPNKLTAEELQQLSQIVSERLKADWKFNARIITAVVLVAVVVIEVTSALFGWSLNEKIAKDFQNQEKQAKDKIDDRLKGLDQDVKQSLAQVDYQMRSNIVSNFETTNIQAIMENVAKTEAKALLETEVRPAVDSFRNDALFIRTIARAQAYEFKAYQQLLKIGTQTNDNAKLANQVVAEIDRSLQRDRSEILGRTTYARSSGTNVYGGPFTCDELASWFSSTEQDKTSLNREGFVNTVRDLKQPLFLPLLIEFFTNETDLLVADRLTMAISDSAKTDFHPHDFERITAWWKDHRESYTNWPLAAMELGFHEFSSVHYPQAAEAFEQVLKLDSGADMSRALAIACYWETGQTNRAAMLAKEFKTPSARWAQWASAKAELEAGNVSNATVHFFSITTNFPSLGQLPVQGGDVFRHINWQLFNKLKATEKP